MFKIGQDVVCVDAKHSNHLVNGEIYKVVEVCYSGTHLIVNRDGYTGEESTYSINRFEITVGHRIDKCKCVATRTYENGTCNKCGLQDTDDNSDLEYHVSPLCKIEVK
ncbi:MAG: hypothetical protein RR282_00720 [Acinetobacter sp.]